MFFFWVEAEKFDHNFFSLFKMVFSQISLCLSSVSAEDLRITPMKPPGGESKLNLKEDEEGEVQEEELEERCVRWEQEQECFVTWSVFHLNEIFASVALFYGMCTGDIICIECIRWIRWFKWIRQIIWVRRSRCTRWIIEIANCKIYVPVPWDEWFWVVKMQYLAAAAWKELLRKVGIEAALWWGGGHLFQKSTFAGKYWQ